MQGHRLCILSMTKGAEPFEYIEVVYITAESFGMGNNNSGGHLAMLAERQSSIDLTQRRELWHEKTAKEIGHTT